MCLPKCKALKSGMPSRQSTTASPSITNCLVRFLRAASAIHGTRLGPVVAAAGNQPDVIAVAFDAVAIVFDFVEPLGTDGTALPVVGMQNSNLGMGRRYVFRPERESRPAKNA